MRLSVFGGSLAVLALLASAAHAQSPNANYCLVSGSEGGSETCIYRTLQDCLEDRIGQGGACVLNSRRE